MSLRSFLKRMEAKGEVLHVTDEVSTEFEVSYLMKRFDNAGPILLFENVKDCGAKIVANVCGTRNRICEALGVTKNEVYPKLLEAWRSPKRPKIVEAEVVEGLVDEPDLSFLPILKHFERDAGPYITSGVVYAKSIDGTVENVSIHRLQVLDEKRMAIRLVPRHLYKIWHMAKDENNDLDVAISIGVHPTVMLAASSSIPFGISEFDVANALLDGNLHLLKCRHVNALAPKDAELIIEGKISATKEVLEGPFVDITGTYDIARKQPVVEVVNVMHRKDFIYQALLPSGAEHKLLMGLPRETSIYEAVSKVVPKVCGVNLSVGGSGWLHAIISIDKQLEGDGKNALIAAFAAHPSLKHAVVVDSDIDLFDICDVEWAIATRFQACEDMLIIENARGSTLDSSADQETGLTTKMGIDATRPLTKPRENFERAKIPTSKRIEDLVQELLDLKQ